MKIHRLNSNCPETRFVPGFVRSLIVFVAALALINGVATRYCTPTGAETSGQTIVHAHALDGKRQRLLRDALQWAAPAPSPRWFEPHRAWTAPSRFVTPSYYSNLTFSLSNRPPPASC